MRLFLSLLFLSISSFAQIEIPTKWSYKVNPSTAKVGDEVEVVFSAKINKGWKMYAAEMDPEIGPIVLEFAFKNQRDIQLVGKPKPSRAPKKVREEVWEMNEGEQVFVQIYYDNIEYKQKAKITGVNPSFTTDLVFQSCEENGRCINGEESFKVDVKVEGNACVPEIIEDKTAENIDQPDETRVDTTSATVIEESEKQGLPVNNKPIESEKDGGMWKFLLVAFGAGFASIFMPCIYPIMPMTITFFTKQKGGKGKAMLYGLFIMLIFAIIGLITMPLGASFMNELSTHWLPNVIFFTIFILFGFAFLGAFDIILPHETVNKIDRLSDKGGVIGIFFMALTLVVVSFSCTVPFVGSLLIGAAGGEVLKPVYGMLAFGAPFALVFGGLAMFPKLLSKLPKSGGWLNELKVVFGLLEFALALKFLSNIDLAYHWDTIHRNIFLVVWIVIAVIIGLYILGLIRFPKDEKVEERSFLRIFFSSIFIGFAIYMIPGVTNEPLKVLSGILPPLPTNQEIAPDKMKALPHGLYGFKEIEDALIESKKLRKPVLVDFTGYACANCRKMEENVWSKSDILKSLKEDFVIASLYVDDKKELPSDKQYISPYDNKLKNTIGAKNFDYQLSRYNSNAQPYYVILDSKEEMIVDPVAYTSYENFKEFLDKGKAAFRK